MKYRMFFCIAIGLTAMLGTAAAADFVLMKDGVGPIHATATIAISGAFAELTASARNDLGRPITYAKFCIAGMGQKKCAFELWTTALWKPGEELKWNLRGRTTRGIESPVMVLEDLRKAVDPPPVPALPTVNPRFANVRTIYVEPIEGTGGALERERLMALLANSKTFRAVDDASTADAHMKGIAEVDQSGTVATGNTSVGGVSVFSAAKTTTQTHFLTTETVVLRLMSPSGEILWAWDDTKPCAAAKAKCAIDDLVNSTVIQPSPPTVKH